MVQVICYTEKITTRLQYIVAFLLGKDVHITDQLTEAHIFYSNNKPDHLDVVWIQPQGLLEAEDIAPQEIQITKDTTPIFFQNESDLGFDIFAATFYLLSRYEEYLPFQKDEYGRYAVENSLAFQNNFLELPLIDIWRKALQDKIHSIFPQIIFPKIEAKYIPTFDIDVAYSYQGKSFFRNIGGGLKDLLNKNLNQVKSRISVLFRREQDPFDTYILIEGELKKLNSTAIFFFPIARKIQGYDKNILPKKAILQNLIRKINATYPVGMHPSWHSGDDKNEFIWEKQYLESIIEQPISKSRQHYIRMLLPEKYQQLIELHIQEDFSMGYGSRNGFRASTAYPFYWFDLTKNEITPLKIFPFCFMDANSFYEQHFSASEMLEEFRNYWSLIQKFGGNLISIMHNNFLSEQVPFVEYRQAILQFWKEMQQKENNNSIKD
ncbi:DUF7033 domain-containing protein [Rhizosphaericola mali]|uniref:DUF7033 domain-containing protein n=1 Tax=Rhizosphaericola mali TaxID=2545455 RepID=A0A5P2G2F2_9BACT|nr:hypothetical protein [Rhizosphaericola mali]QES87273.1 hypothetical protein E0W69_000880 [Rhizosphaericola mali]